VRACVRACMCVRVLFLGIPAPVAKIVHTLIATPSMILGPLLVVALHLATRVEVRRRGSARAVFICFVDRQAIFLL